MDEEEGDKLCPNRQATGCMSPCPRTRHSVTQEAGIFPRVGRYTGSLPGAVFSQEPAIAQEPATIQEPVLSRSCRSQHSRSWFQEPALSQHCPRSRPLSRSWHFPRSRHRPEAGIIQEAGII